MRDEMQTREALLVELSPALREAAMRADELKAFCGENGLMLAAVVSEKAGDDGELNVATQLTGQTGLLARSIDCLARRLFAVARQGAEL